MLPEPPSRQVQSVRTSFEILNTIQNLGRATPSDLAEELSLSKSSVHNYLATLETEGYVVNERRSYRLGLRFLTHGIAAKKTLNVQKPIVSALESISTNLGYPTWWVAEELGRGIFLEGEIPEGQTQTYGGTGTRSYLHTHALGKAILAASPEEYIEQIIERYGLPDQTSRTTSDRDELFDEIEEIRDRGFAISDGEAVLGILSVGVAFRDNEDRVHAIGIFGNSRDLVGTQALEIGQELADLVDILEEELQTEDTQ